MKKILFYKLYNQSLWHIQYTIKDINKNIISNLTIVDFWANWCGPCRMLKPILHTIADENKEIQLLTVDVDVNGELAAQYDINSIPAVFMFKNGEIVDSFVGVMPENEILEKIQKFNSKSEDEIEYKQAA